MAKNDKKVVSEYQLQAMAAIISRIQIASRAELDGICKRIANSKETFHNAALAVLRNAVVSRRRELKYAAIIPEEVAGDSILEW